MIGSKMSIGDIAGVAWEAYRGYMEGCGYHDLLEWEELDPERRLRLVDGVAFYLANPLADPRDAHENWLRWMASVDMPVAPEMQDWATVSQFDKTKGFIFRRVVLALGRRGNYSRVKIVREKRL